ncbi:MAG: lipopolysaccharide biosynthesis protein [Planctomycetaceae bacterium]|nr:lipopolysaccharide biosynthesis protein [Planctomycetaceae bacterium]
MADKAAFLKHTLIFGIGGTLAQIAPLILFPLYMNYLSPADYGTLDVIDQITYLINITFMVNGISLATLTFYRQAGTEEERRRVAVTLSLFLWGIISIAILIAICFAGAIDLFLKTGNPRLLAFGLSVALLDPLLGIPMMLMQARLESVRYVLTSWTTMFVRVGLNVLFLGVFHWGIWGVYMSSLITIGTMSIVLTYREFTIGSMRPDFSKWKEVLKFCLPFIPTSIIAFVYENAGRFAIIQFNPYGTAEAALAAIGVYAMSRKLVKMAGFGTRPLMQVWMSTMYEVKKQDDAASVFGHFALRMLCVHSFFVLGIATFASEIIRAVCDPKYYEAVHLVPVFAVAALITTFGSNMEQTYYIERKTYWKPLIVTIALISTMIFLPLLFKYGIFGVALTAAITTFISSVATYLTTQQFFKVRYPFGKIFLLLTMTAGFYAVSCCFGNAVTLGNITFEELSNLSKWNRVVFLFLHIDWLIVAVKFAIIGIWCLTLWKSGILSDSDKRFAVQSLKKIKDKLFRRR